MFKWLRSLFVGEKGVASTPEVVTPVSSVSQERVEQINRETEKVLEEVKAENEKKAETAPKQAPKQDWTKAKKPGIQKKATPKPQSTAATKSKAVKARKKLNVSV